MDLKRLEIIFKSFIVLQSNIHDFSKFCRRQPFTEQLSLFFRTFLLGIYCSLSFQVVWKKTDCKVQRGKSEPAR